jgi:hypothetical protein
MYEIIGPILGNPPPQAVNAFNAYTLVLQLYYDVDN